MAADVTRAAKKTSKADQRKALFVEAYLTNGGNATAAAKTAGYSAKTARAQGSRLLTNVDIKGAVEKRRTEVIASVEKKTEVTKEWITEKLRTVAERCMQVSPVLDKKGDPILTETPDGTLAMAFEFNSAGANRALELLGKEHGMFVERKEVGKPGEFNEPKEVIRARILERKVKLGLAKAVRQEVKAVVH